MNRLLLVLLSGLSMAASVAMAAGDHQHGGMAVSMAGMSGHRHGGGRPSKPTSTDCSTEIRDFYWIDAGGGMMAMMMGQGKEKKSWKKPDESKGEAGEKPKKSRGHGMRSRTMRLKHNAFPPPEMAAMGGHGHGGKPKGRPEKRGEQSGRPQGPQAAFWLETPDHLIQPLESKKPGQASVDSRLGGQHRVFSFLDAGVKGHSRNKFFSYYGFYGHGDKPPEQKPTAMSGAGFRNGQPELLIEAIQDAHAYSTETGAEARFRVSFQGKPLAGQCVVMLTQKGWRNAKRTNDQGEVSFFVIQENPIESGWMSRRQSSKYLVLAQHDAAIAGQLGDQLYADTRYTATMSLQVRPSKLQWESNSMAYLLAAFTSVSAGSAIAIRRRRKRSAEQQKATESESEKR